MSEVREERLCSVVSQEAGDDPAGSAGAFFTALMVEVPPPWNRDVSASRRFPTGLGEALAPHDRAGTFQKLTAFLPETDRSVADHTRLFLYARPADGKPFAAYNKTEYLVPNNRLADSLDGIFSGSREYALENDRDTREIFVCTHNNRDVCCGRFGTETHRALKEVESDALRVWRCSHLGGHRFASTMLDFPAGVLWGHVSPEKAAALVLKTMNPAEAARLYRGWPGLKSRYEQIADREIFAREGWDWLKTPRSGKVTHRDVNSDTAGVEISTPDSKFTATVEPAGSVMTLASSGTEPLIEAIQYRVTNLRST